MLNLLTKTTPWMVASLLVAASGFGQDNRCCPPPKPKPQCCEPVKCEKVCPPVCPIQLIPAYNHPAGIETRCSWDVWVDASFTYWQAIQDNMEVGIADVETDIANLGSQITNGKVIDMGFKYKPGFKVGAGIKFDHDDWDAHAEYTWFRSKVNVHSNGLEGDNVTTFAAIYPMVGMPVELGGRLFDNVSSDWTCNMDIIDATMGRWYYVGTKLTFHPYAGARAQWIRQKFNTFYSNDNSVIDGIHTLGIRQKSNSWAIGPEVGLDMNWMIGEGFRLYTCGEGDILFTRYNRMSDEELFLNPSLSISEGQRVTQRHVNRVRAHLDLEMGFGWGTYLDCNNWYLDLSAGYGFQVFFDQNMFRNFVDDVSLGKSFAPNGNLYVHGLTATVALHF